MPNQVLTGTAAGGLFPGDIARAVLQPVAAKPFAPEFAALEDSLDGEERVGGVGAAGLGGAADAGYKRSRAQRDEDGEQ